MTNTGDISVIDNMFQQLENYADLDIRNGVEILKHVRALDRKLKAHTKLLTIAKHYDKIGDPLTNAAIEILKLPEAEYGVNVLVALIRNGYKPLQISVISMLRRVISAGTPAILSYFRLDKFMDSHSRGQVLAKDILDFCLTNYKTYDEYCAEYLGAPTIRLKLLEELGGLSAATTDEQLDIEFKRFCMRAHPDKGGNINTFIRVKNTYEEYKNLTTTRKD